MSWYFCFLKQPFFSGEEPIHDRIRENGRGQHERGRFWPNFGRGETSHSVGDDDLTSRVAGGSTMSQGPGDGSQNSRPAPRSSHEELKIVRGQLFDWLDAHEVEGDHSQASTTFMLNNVYATQSKRVAKLEEKLIWRDTKLRGYEVEKAAAVQENSRLERRLEDERGSARTEIARLCQIATDWETRLKWEHGEKARVAAAHAEQVVFLKEQHRLTAEKLTSKHQRQLETMKGEHNVALETLESLRQADIRDERQKVEQAETVRKLDG